MVEKLNLEATEPTTPNPMESDQPEDEDVVSLADVLGETDPEEVDGEEATGADTQAGDADPQPGGEKPEKLLTQADFDRAFGERAQGLHRKFLREHEEELRLAALVKEAYGGKSAEEIERELLAAQARELAEQTGWDEEEALKKVQARKRFETTGRVDNSDDGDDPHLMLLQNQLAGIQKREGVDMLAIINADAYLSEQVDTGAMDIKDAYAHYLKNQLAAPRRKAPKPERAGGVHGAGIDGAMLTDTQFAKIDAQLKSGYKVRLE